MCNKCDKSKMEDLGCLPHGAHLYRKPNTAGGWTYYSDEVGGGVMVWNTCLVNESTLLTAIVCEHQRSYCEKMLKSGWKPSPKMIIEQIAATGGSFIPPDVQKAFELDVEQLKANGYPSSVIKYHPHRTLCSDK